MAALNDEINIQRWIRIAFINLLIVAVLGVIMRYKISFYLPFIEQSNFQHAHSNFAFSGWVTQILMVLMLSFLYNYLSHQPLKIYKALLIANLLCAYGMLFSFALSGYGIFSSIFSTSSILVSWLFAAMFWIDLNKIKDKIVSKQWFKAALVFNIISSFGAFVIAYMMANQIQHPNWFLASTYYFLHFQYNGWFFFACMGLLSEQLNSSISYSLQKKVFWLFALSCIPAYFLSALWLPIPALIYVLVVLSAIAELLGWILILKAIILNKSKSHQNLSSQTRWLFILSATALSIKLLLQVGSTIPALSKLAFGFRPVVIGYLHLMFLGVISLFIIGYCKMKQFNFTARSGNTGIMVFVAGIILNELLLMVQGVSSMNYISVPYINELLLGAAVCMLVGLIVLNLGVQKKTTI